MNYIWTGEYYFYRCALSDNAPDNVKNALIRPIELFDSTFNLIKEYTPPSYALNIDYYNGAYYVRCFGGGYGGAPDSYYTSTDFENWTEVEEFAPSRNGTVFYQDKSVSFDGNVFYDVHYEKSHSYALSQYGNLIISGKWRDYAFSTDNVYYTFVNDVDGESNAKFMYEYNGIFVIDTSTERFTVPIQSIYDELERLKNPTYVMLDDTILGFQEVPVIESDRTLVPMRFLFEQMGETVEWQGETQTAKVIGAQSVVSFSINDTTATVNGAPAEMDVPARLINDKTMVPLRFLSEELGYTVEWDAEHNIAKIITE
jgi:hypothetical protein